MYICKGCRVVLYCCRSHQKKIGVNTESFARRLREWSWRNLRIGLKFSQCVQMKSKVTRFLLPKSRNFVFDMYILCFYKNTEALYFFPKIKNTQSLHTANTVQTVFLALFLRLCTDSVQVEQSLHIVSEEKIQSPHRVFQDFLYVSFGSEHNYVQSHDS